MDENSASLQSCEIIGNQQFVSTSVSRLIRHKIRQDNDIRNPSLDKPLPPGVNSDARLRARAASWIRYTRIPCRDSSACRPVGGFHFSISLTERLDGQKNGCLRRHSVIFLPPHFFAYLWIRPKAGTGYPRSKLFILTLFVAADQPRWLTFTLDPMPSTPTNPKSVSLAVLISGGGTTLANFLEKIAAGELSAEIPLVIASRSDCRGVERARQAGLRCEVVERRSFANVSEFSQSVFAHCRDARVDLVTLAGFLSLIEIPPDFEYRVMNVHPALIPSFCGEGYYGHKVHEAVLARGAKVSGCTVHFADNHYDHGPIIAQTAVEVLDDDTPDSLAARVFAAECLTYPAAINLYAQGRLEIIGNRVRVRRMTPPSTPLKESHVTPPLRKGG
jgi:formyltetrahydrofolate-dependent phosphoribosylglycinamide formyltransferase